MTPVRFVTNNQWLGLPTVAHPVPEGPIIYGCRHGTRQFSTKSITGHRPDPTAAGHTFRTHSIMTHINNSLSTTSGLSMQHFTLSSLFCELEIYHSSDQITKNEMGGGMWHLWQTGGVHTGFWWGNLRERTRKT